MSVSTGIGIEEDHRFPERSTWSKRCWSVRNRHELDALPVGAVITDHFGVPHVKSPNGMWWVNDGRTAHDIALPAIVLHEGEAA